MSAMLSFVDLMVTDHVRNAACVNYCRDALDGRTARSSQALPPSASAAEWEASVTGTNYCQREYVCKAWSTLNDSAGSRKGCGEQSS